MRFQLLPPCFLITFAAVAASASVGACSGEVTSVGSEAQSGLGDDGGAANGDSAVTGDAASADAACAHRCCTSTGFRCMPLGVSCTLLDSACEPDGGDAGTVITRACTLPSSPVIGCSDDSPCVSYGATCYIAPPGTAQPSNYCACPACGGNIASPPKTCGPGLGCNNENPDTSGVCVVSGCTYGQDQTCNADPQISSFHGTCNMSNVCICKPGFTFDPNTGKCS